MKTINQQRVMHYAHSIYQAGGCTWSEALQAAWELHYMRLFLKHGVVEFEYIKKDGSARAARGTNCVELIPPSKQPTGRQQLLIDTGALAPNWKSIAYFDLDKEAWRAFSVESFQKVRKVAFLSTEYAEAADCPESGQK